MFRFIFEDIRDAQLQLSAISLTTLLVFFVCLLCGSAGGAVFTLALCAVSFRFTAFLIIPRGHVFLPFVRVLASCDAFL